MIAKNKKHLIMKKIFIIGLFLILSSVASAQVKKGDYIQDMNLQKFVGTWQWTAEQDTFTIIFEKEKVFFEDPGTHMDMILGWYKYVINGDTIDNSLNLVGSSLEKSNLSGTSDEDNPYKLNLTFRDPRGDEILRAKGLFQIDSKNSDEAILKLHSNSGVLVGESRPPNKTDIPIPSTWKMKRIE